MSYLIRSDVLPRSITSPFIPLDSEKQFKINQTVLGKDWYWYDKSFTYQINDYGYRMNKDLHKVNLSNYMAFFGCSYTIGQGLPLEETFAYKIAQRANMDYVNAAISGASTDTVFYNFTKLISTAPILPKIVVINWPHYARTMYWYKDSIIDFLPYTQYVDHKSEGVKFWMNSYKSHVLESSNYLNRLDYIRQNIITFCNLARIKLFEFTTHQYGDAEYKYTNSRMWYLPWVKEWPIALQGQELLEFQNRYFARDIVPRDDKILKLLKFPNYLIGWAHPGIEYQDQIVDKFFSTVTI
jgi:hypothetical protein